MAITFVNAGTEGAAGAGTTLAPGSPSSPANGDIWICAVNCSAGLTPSMHADWTLKFLYTPTTGTIAVWWFRYAGTPPTDNTITTASSTANRVAGITAWRGCKASGDPFEGSEITDWGFSPTALYASLTPLETVNLNAMVLAIAGTQDDVAMSVVSPFAAALEDSAGGTQAAYVDATGSPDGAVGVFYAEQLLPGVVPVARTILGAGATSIIWITGVLALIPEPTHEIVGVSRDVDGDPLVSVDCYLLKYDTDTFAFIAHQVSDGTTGAYAFQFAESAGTYAVAFRKEGSPNVYDITDFNLAPVAI